MHLCFHPGANPILFKSILIRGRSIYRQFPQNILIRQWGNNHPCEIIPSSTRKSQATFSVSELVAFLSLSLSPFKMTTFFKLYINPNHWTRQRRSSASPIVSSAGKIILTVLFSSCAHLGVRILGSFSGFFSGFSESFSLSLSLCAWFPISFTLPIIPFFYLSPLGTQKPSLKTFTKRPLLWFRPLVPIMAASIPSFGGISQVSWLFWFLDSVLLQIAMCFFNFTID